MGSSPKLGARLPRAAEAWCESTKWEGWILARRGHGPEWAKVLHVGPDDVEAIWKAISTAVLLAPVSRVIDLGEYGISCRVDVQLTIRKRSAQIRTAWHYADAESPPRLVSAYPKL